VGAKSEEDLRDPGADVLRESDSRFGRPSSCAEIAWDLFELIEAPF
jgi:hypothetical protein